LLRGSSDPKAIHSYYFEFGRRLEVLKLVEEYCKQGSAVLDLGAQPFIVSCALKKMGYNVTASDIDPEPYMKIAEACGVDVVRCDLERDELCVNKADCAVFTEVFEHLHYYYVPLVLSKINRALKPGGVLILTTPNIASLFRRARLLLGIQPIYQYHVREYAMSEVVALLREAGFEIIKAYYSIINDLTFIDANPEEHLKISSFKDMAKIVLKKPTKLNILRLLACPHSKAKAKPKAIDSGCRDEG
jgi:2-polyprenyl-3-methyl-5-hydroxy-6-metoxy-1,4-benzoquinol methylase